MKKVLIALAVVLLLAAGVKVGYEIYMITREYTIDDINGIWVGEVAGGGHIVMYIHDGHMDYMRYEKPDEKQATGFDKYRYMTMDKVPEGSFNKFSWFGSFDLERTDSQSSISGLTEYDGYHFEFRRGRIYETGLLLGGEIEFVRGKEEEHPHIVKMSKALDQSYQLSRSQLPLETGELQVYTSENDYGYLYFSVRITNPNPYLIDMVYVTLEWEKPSEEKTVRLAPVPANSSEVYAGSLGVGSAFGSEDIPIPTKCTLSYNEYNVYNDVSTNPVVEITGSRVIKDEATGKVKQIEVDTKAGDTAGKNSLYDLYALFYKQGEIVGVATGYGNLDDIDQPDVMTDVSNVVDYDDCKVVVVSKYNLLIHER